MPDCYDDLLDDFIEEEEDNSVPLFNEQISDAIDESFSSAHLDTTVESKNLCQVLSTRVIDKWEEDIISYVTQTSYEHMSDRQIFQKHPDIIEINSALDVMQNIQ